MKSRKTRRSKRRVSRKKSRKTRRTRRTRKKKQRGGSQAEEVICNICFEPLSNGTAEYITACGHTFHYKEIKMWVDRGNTTCPVCRQEINLPMYPSK